MDVTKLDSEQLLRLQLSKQAESASIKAFDAVTIEVIPSYTLCALEAEQGYNIDGIFRSWKRILDWYDDIGNGKNQKEWFGLSYDNRLFTPLDKARYFVSVAITPDVSEQVILPYKVHVIPQGSYAIFPFCGTVKQLVTLYVDLYSIWLPSSGYEPEDAPSIEYYDGLITFNKSMDENTTIKLQIWLKIKPLNR